MNCHCQISARANTQLPSSMTRFLHKQSIRPASSERKVAGNRSWTLNVFLVIALLLAYVPVALAQTPSPGSGSPTPDTGGAGSSEAQSHQETLEARVLSASPPGPCTAAESNENGMQVDPLTGKAELCQKLELLITKGST